MSPVSPTFSISANYCTDKEKDQDLIEGVHHEQGDVEEDDRRVAFESRRPVLHHNQVDNNGFFFIKFVNGEKSYNLVIRGFIW